MAFTFLEMGAEDIPYCALADDKVLEIQGEPANVHKALELVVSHLRKFLVDRSVLPLFEMNVMFLQCYSAVECLIGVIFCF